MNKNIPCKLRPIQKTDIPILYELLKESLSQRYTSVYDSKLPTYEKSEKFVLDFLKKNKDHYKKSKTKENTPQSQKSHEFDKWYVIINPKKEIVGQVFITKNDYLGYGVLKKFRRQGIASEGIRLIMKRHPRKRYYLTIHQKNKESLGAANKLGFKPKGLILEKIPKQK